MRVLFQLLGAAAAVAVAGISAAVLAKKMGKKSPVQVTVDLAEDAETDQETADKTAAAYEAGVDDTVIVLVDNLEKASTSPDFDPDATYIYLRNAIEKEVQNGQMDLQN